VSFESVLELLSARLLDHAGQRFENVLLGVVDVFQGLYEQVFHRLDSHGFSPGVEK
jgi:hypothetical protein